MSRSRPLIGGVIALYFVIGLEVLVMISPFAAFFYAAFNPFLLFLARWPATHWLADFFLPHMVLPPGALLKVVRVAGSVLFVGGASGFLICAAQVYFHKISRRGPALSGLYAWIRHPQYGALASAFALRSYTVARLPLWSNGQVSVLAVLPGDAIMVQHRMEDVLRMPEVRSRLVTTGGAVLGYLVPTQYVMQGMIADTDPAYRLYERHQTMGMIADWIFHPFRHLEGGHAMTHHATVGVGAAASPTVRRVIFLRVGESGGASASEPFGNRVGRRPDADVLRSP
jgi:hypothetical protein